LYSPVATVTSYKQCEAKNDYHIQGYLLGQWTVSQTFLYTAFWKMELDVFEESQQSLSKTTFMPNVT
jgi:hypothetical protein